MSKEVEELLHNARESHAQGKFAEAVKHCDEALSLQQSNILAWLLKAHSLLMLSEFEESLKASESGEKFAGAEEKEAFSLIEIADKLNLGKVPDDIEQELFQLEQSDSRSVRLRAEVFLVAFYLVEGDWKKALKAYKKVDLEDPKEGAAIISSLAKRLLSEKK